MRVQLLKTMRGTKNEKPIDWIKGTIFDDSKEPIPNDILRAVKTKSPSVLVLGDSHEASGKLEAELESARSRIAQLEEQIEDLATVNYTATETIAKLREEVDTQEEIEKPKAEQIRDLLNDTDLTQAEIAQKVGTSPAYVSNVARKKSND